MKWIQTSEGFVSRFGPFSLRVSWRLDNGQYAYFVHKDGDENQYRGEAESVEDAKSSALELAEGLHASR